MHPINLYRQIKHLNLCCSHVPLTTTTTISCEPQQQHPTSSELDTVDVALLSALSYRGYCRTKRCYNAEFGKEHKISWTCVRSPSVASRIGFCGAIFSTRDGKPIVGTCERGGPSEPTPWLWCSGAGSLWIYISVNIVNHRRHMAHGSLCEKWVSFFMQLQILRVLARFVVDI